MKIILVNPFNVGWMGLQNILQLEPLGLQVIGAALRQDHDVRILDLRFEPDYERVLASWKPDLVAISCLYTSHVGATWELAARAKETLAGVPVVVGGQPPTMAPELFYSPAINAVIRGDGELTLPEVCRAIQKNEALDQIPGLSINNGRGQYHTQDRPRPVDLSTTPSPCRHLSGIKKGDYFMAVNRDIAPFELTRGCQFRCNFCSIWKYAEGTVRSLSIDAAVAELASIDEGSIFVTDDHFFFDADYMKALGKAIVDAGIKKRITVQSRADVIAKNPEMIDIWVEAGLDWVFLGLDGHSDTRLNTIKKSARLSTNETALRVLRDRGVGMSGNLIVDPSFTRQDFAQLRDYVRANDMHFVTYCITTPFPGTEVWKTRRDEITTLDFELYDLGHAVMKTHLPLDEFYQEFAGLWQLRKSMQPRGVMWHDLKRFAVSAVREGFKFQLVNNLLRFNRDTCRPSAYLRDHARSKRVEDLPWGNYLAGYQQQSEYA